MVLADQLLHGWAPRTRKWTSVKTSVSLCRLQLVPPVQLCLLYLGRPGWFRQAAAHYLVRQARTSQRHSHSNDGRGSDGAKRPKWSWKDLTANLSRLSRMEKWPLKTKILKCAIEVDRFVLVAQFRFDMFMSNNRLHFCSSHFGFACFPKPKR